MNRRLFLVSTALVAASRLRIAGHRATTRLVCSAFDAYGLQQCEAGIDSSILDVVASDRQHAPEWCWAACIEAVFDYYGHTVSQERIVSEMYGSVVNMPASPSMLLTALNKTWTDDAGSKFRSEGMIVGTTPAIAAQDLAADHPLIIGALGHAMVLTSLTYVRAPSGQGNVVLAVARDPWPYNPAKRALTPQEWYNVSFAARIRVEDQ